MSLKQLLRTLFITSAFCVSFCVDSDHEQLLTRVMKKDFFELANVNDDDDNGNSGLAKRSSEFFVRSLRSNNGLETDNHNRMRRFGSDYLARSLRSNDGSLTRSMRAGQGSDYLARTMRSRNSKLVRSPPVPNNYLIRAMWVSDIIIIVTVVIKVVPWLKHTFTFYLVPLCTPVRTRYHKNLGTNFAVPT